MPSMYVHRDGTGFVEFTRTPEERAHIELLEKLEKYEDLEERLRKLEEGGIDDSTKD